MSTRPPLFQVLGYCIHHIIVASGHEVYNVAGSGRRAMVMSMFSLSLSSCVFLFLPLFLLWGCSPFFPALFYSYLCQLQRWRHPWELVVENLR